MLLPALLVLPLLATAPDKVDRGRFVFHDRSIGTNGVACADCHASIGNESDKGDGLIRAGHSLFGVGQRPYWRGDHRRQLLKSLPEAVDVCVELFMGGTPLEGGARSTLSAFLMSLKTARTSRTPLKIETALEADLNYDRPKYRGGDADQGRILFYRACHGCHPHGGAGVAPTIIGSRVKEVAAKVREGNGLLRGSRQPGAWMPAYGPDRLSHRAVADIAAFVETLERSSKAQ